MYGSERGVPGNRYSYRDFNVDFFSSSGSLYTVLVAAGSSGSRPTLWVARLMDERSKLNRRASSHPEIDKICEAT